MTDKNSYWDLQRGIERYTWFISDGLSGMMLHCVGEIVRCCTQLYQLLMMLYIFYPSHYLHFLLCGLQHVCSTLNLTQAIVTPEPADGEPRHGGRRSQRRKYRRLGPGTALGGWSCLSASSPLYRSPSGPSVAEEWRRKATGKELNATLSFPSRAQLLTAYLTHYYCYV